MIIHNFYCTKCGKQGIPIQRKPGQKREAGHLKKIYCIYCKKEVNFVEISSNYTYEDFLIEFNNHNFDEFGNRKLKYGKLKHLLRTKGDVNSG